jgi:N-acetylglucosaminyl-diphospho-decaprenol L-rhamnosyltransferase
MTPNFGLVVVGYESDAEWPDFFRCLAASAQLPRSIVVVDNSPTCRIEPHVGKELSVTIRHEPGNLGYGGAANRGVAQLPEDLEWVVICNPDTRVEPDTFDELMAHLEVLPRTAVVGPAIITPNNEVYPSARAIPGIRIGIGHALLGDLWPNNPWSLAYLGNRTSGEARSAGWLSGAFLMINRAAFDSVGGFDEQYFMFFEDVDLGFRMKKAGLRNVYVPSARVHHSGAHATASREKDMLVAHHRSAEIFLATLYPRWFHAPLRGLLRRGLRVRAWIRTRGMN